MGCALIGYDPIRLDDSRDDNPPAHVSSDTGTPEQRANDGGESSGVDAAGATLDAGTDSGPPDASVSMPDAARADAGDPGDAAAPTDGGPDAGPDAGADAGADAGPDAGADAGPACTTPNACGGCTTLPNAPGSSCGSCGLDGFACDGSEAVVCSPGDTTPAAAQGDLLIDDFEDGDRYANVPGGINGAWYTVDDGSGGTITPPPGNNFLPTGVGQAPGSIAARVIGSGFTDWGGSVSVSMNEYNCRYDASSTQGLVFTVRGSGSVVLSVATAATLPLSSGGTCLLTCNDHYQRTIALSSSWTEYTIPWTSLSQGGWGTPALFNKSRIYYIEFVLPAGATTDLSIDDIWFY